MAKTNARQTPAQGEESIAGYFRKVFRENPKLLRSRSNEELLRRWLARASAHFGQSRQTGALAERRIYRTP
jgi:hypothetical protein